MSTIVRELESCIFCDDDDMTEEHLIADWAHRAFAKRRNPENLLRGTLVGDGQMALTAEDPVVTARVICRSCNNTWMSAIDNAAAQVLKPLVRGEREASLDSRGQSAVAAWIYKSALIFDAADNGADGELASLRAGFMASRLAGPGCVIWVGPATRQPLIDLANQPTKIRLWMMGIRPAVGKMHLVVNVMDPTTGVTSPGKPMEIPIPGYQVMIGALWAYLGGQISPVMRASLDGFRQIWPAQNTPVSITAASLADPPTADTFLE